MSKRQGILSKRKRGDFLRFPLRRNSCFVNAVILVACHKVGEYSCFFLLFCLHFSFQRVMSNLPREQNLEGRVVSCSAATPLVAAPAAVASHFAVVKAEETGGASGSTSTDLASHFECPVCFDYVLPPILQCSSGHLVCSDCRAKLTCCPSCRGPLGSIRNLAMERVAEDVFFPCKFRSCGCPQDFRFKKKKEHEDICEFRPYMCPCPGAQCKW